MRRFLTMLLLLLAASCAFAQIDTSKWLVLNGIKDDGNWCHFTNNQSVSGGELTLAINSGSFTCNPGGTGVPYSTPMLFSANGANTPFSFTYGVVKASIKFGSPGGSANTIWSALWMWGGASGSYGYPSTCFANVLTPGNTMNACTTGSAATSYEVDIAEDPSSMNIVNNNIFTWVNGSSTAVNTGNCTVSTDLGAAFHIYELDWYPSKLIFKVDGVTCNTYSYSLSVPMFLILDMESPAVHGSAGTTVVRWARVCSSPTAQCNPGDPTLIFSDGFNESIVPTNHAIQGKTLQGVAIQ